MNSSSNPQIDEHNDPERVTPSCESDQSGHDATELVNKPSTSNCVDIGVTNVASDQTQDIPHAAAAKPATDMAPEPARAEVNRADREETYQLFREFLQERRVFVRFDGTCDTYTGPLMATNREEIDAVLRRVDVNERWLLNEFIMEMKARGLKVRKGDAERAANKALTRAKLRRRRNVLKPLLEPLAPAEQEKSDQVWARLSSIFDMDGDLSTRILGHYIWEAKQKQLNRPVLYHLMPIVVSPLQGSGKTTFARRFLSPLEELATGPVLLTDFADPRNIDLYRYPAILVDDVGRIPPNMVSTLKSLVTAETFRRRQLGTSMSVGVRQRATLFGTSNNPIEQLVPDSTGHRRFATLPFHNGAVEKDGDPEVWKTVTDTDYFMLWRSVDAFKPSPIETHLEALFKHQESAAPPSPLKAWLVNLDVLSEAVLRITTSKGVQANELYEMYIRETGSDISCALFGAEIKRHLGDPAVPFAAYVRDGKGRYYSLKKGLMGLDAGDHSAKSAA
jgi:hypothetical protein